MSHFLFRFWCFRLEFEDAQAIIIQLLGGLVVLCVLDMIDSASNLNIHYNFLTWYLFRISLLDFGQSRLELEDAQVDHEQFLFN